MTTRRCASRCPTCCRCSGSPPRHSHRREEFLASDRIAATRCLILDIAMPGMSGTDLQRELAARRRSIPIVFITAHTGEAAGPRLLEQGAVACLLKPFSDVDLRVALTAALRAG
jgi:FixJ family two-component response regulator